MSALWVNLNRRGRDPNITSRLRGLIGAEKAKLVFLQELAAGEGCLLSLEPLRPLYIGADLNAFADPKLGPIQVSTGGTRNFIRTASFNDILFCNVHLSAQRQSSIREAQLHDLSDLFGRHRGQALAVGGDFNLAPREQDGYFVADGRISRWTGQRERAVFGRLLSDHDLVDVLSSGPAGEFTFENASPGGRVRHRCDLLLCTRSILPWIAARYLHGTREGLDKFTDHSGIVLSFNEFTLNESH